jgi:hypothetical protein
LTDAIEHNRQALMRILAMLVAMAGLVLPHPEGSKNGRDPWLAPAEGEPRRTIPRLLRNAVLRLLRPAESAARRLVVALARTLTVTLPKARPGRGQKLRGKRHFEPVMPQAPRTPRGTQNLPLLDRLRRRRGLRTSSAVPRIGFFDRRPAALPPPCRPDDLVDAARLRLRLAALGAALENLPARARRFALWQARQEARRAKGIGGRAAWRPALRPVAPPLARRRGGGRAVDEVRAACHRLATWADTS